MHPAPPHPNARSYQSEPSEPFRADAPEPPENPWFPKSRRSSMPEPPPPPNPALIALQPLSAAALRNSLQASSRIKEDTTDSAALGYLREARIAACFVYRYTITPPSRPRTPTPKELQDRHDEVMREKTHRNSNLYTNYYNLPRHLRNHQPPPHIDLDPETPSHRPDHEPEAPAPLLHDEPDAPASVLAPSPSSSPPTTPTSIPAPLNPFESFEPFESKAFPAPSAPSAPSAFNPAPVTSPDSPSPLRIAHSPLPAPHPFEHTERLRPFDSSDSPAAPPPRSWFFEPNNSSHSSAPSAPSAFIASAPVTSSESPRAP